MGNTRRAVQPVAKGEQIVALELRHLGYSLSTGTLLAMQILRFAVW